MILRMARSKYLSLLLPSQFVMFKIISEGLNAKLKIIETIG
jgi:hypothetical protein